MSEEKKSEQKYAVKIFKVGTISLKGANSTPMDLSPLIKKIETAIENATHGNFSDYLGYQIVTLPYSVFSRGTGMEEEITSWYDGYISYKVKVDSK